MGTVRIEVGPEILTLTGTDLDTYAVETVAATILSELETTDPETGEVKPVAIAIDAHRLNDIVSAFPTGEIKIKLGREDTARLRLSADRTAFNLAKLDPSAFPLDMLRGKHPFALTIAARELHRILDHAAFAMSTEETRYYLNGIYFHKADACGTPKLRATATDGHRLARIDTDWPEGAPDFPGVILPTKFVKQAIKVLGDLAEDDPVSLALSDRQVKLVHGTSELTSKLIDGSFPDYERVIPSHNKILAGVNVADLQKAVARVSKMAPVKGRAVKFSFGGDGLTVSCTDPEYGDSSASLAAEFNGESGFEIGYNCRYVLDILANAGEEVEMQLAGPGDATVFVAPGDSAASAGALFVLMPMRV